MLNKWRRREPRYNGKVRWSTQPRTAECSARPVEAVCRGRRQEFCTAKGSSGELVRSDRQGMKGLLDDAAEKEQQEYGAGLEYVLAMVRVKWRVIMEESLRGTMKDHAVQYGSETLRTPPKSGSGQGKHRWLSAGDTGVWFQLGLGMMMA